MKTLLLATMITLIPLSSFSNEATPLHPQSKEICGKKSCATVRKMFKKMAYRNSALAQKMLGIMYIDSIGTDQNIKKASYFLKKAAKNDDMEAALMLSALYDGLLEKNLEQKEYWMDKAVKISKRTKEDLETIDPLLINYDVEKFTLTDIAVKLKKSKVGIDEMGAGSHILGKGCNQAQSSSCKTRSGIGRHATTSSVK